MKLFHLAIAVAVVSQLSACVVKINRKKADHYQVQSLSLGAESIAELDADVGDGDIVIMAEDNATEITAKAEIYSADDDYNSYDFSLVHKGDKARLRARHNGNSMGFWIGSSPRIDVTVYMPSEMALTLDDTSGDIRVVGLDGAVTIDDGSGNIEIQDIGGKVIIEDNSGDIRLVDVRSSVEVSDGSGEITIRDVLSDVSIDDASGDIYVENVAGTLTINDGSGDIALVNAPKLNLVETGSGDVEIQNLN